MYGGNVYGGNAYGSRFAEGTSHTLSFSETISPSDTLIFLAAKSFAETITLAEAFIKTTLKRFAEAIVLSESLLRTYVVAFAELRILIADVRQNLAPNPSFESTNDWQVGTSGSSSGLIGDINAL